MTTLANDDVLRQAAEWVVRLCDDDVDDAERAAFERWRQADPGHAAAVDGMSGLIAQFDHLRDGQSNVAAAHAALRAGRRRDRKSAKSAALVIFAVLGLLSLLTGLSAYPPSYLLADLKAGTGEWQAHTLADSSRITLNSGSAVNVHFDGGERRLSLVRGEVLVDVARDPSRPFTVETEHGRIRALGTRFVVRREEGLTRLVMLESKTAVQSDAQRRIGNEGVVVETGQAVEITAFTVGNPQAVDARSVADAWKFHQLVAHDRPLSEVLDELARHRPGRILYTDEAHKLRVSAVLPLDDTDRALQLLASSLPIRVGAATPWLVRVRSAQ